jgi:hypothetical protein
VAFINTLYNLWPNGDEKVAGLRDGIALSASSVFAKYGIDSRCWWRTSWPRSATNAAPGTISSRT